MKTVVYTQPDCRACERVIGKLRESGIDPEVIDVSRDLVAKDYLTRFLGASAVPVIEAPGFDAVIGYQPDKVKEIIDALGV